MTLGDRPGIVVIRGDHALTITLRGNSNWQIDVPSLGFGLACLLETCGFPFCMMFLVPAYSRGRTSERIGGKGIRINWKEVL